MAMTGNGGWEFDPVERAWETALTSKEGSRRVNYPILIQYIKNNYYIYIFIYIFNMNFLLLY